MGVQLPTSSGQFAGFRTNCQPVSPSLSWALCLSQLVWDAGASPKLQAGNFAYVTWSDVVKGWFTWNGWCPNSESPFSKGIFYRLPYSSSGVCVCNVCCSSCCWCCCWRWWWWGGCRLGKVNTVVSLPRCFLEVWFIELLVCLSNDVTHVVLWFKRNVTYTYAYA